MPDLTWGLLIATKDRLDALLVCVRLAVTQSLPPSEVIVVDSSATWEDHARQIGEIVGAYPDIRFVYEKGAAPSLTVQRNQAIALAQADIVFMIDDDSFMFPDCAGEIMALYAADTEKAVAGIQATLRGDMPEAAGFAQARKQTGGGSQAPSEGARDGRLARWLKRRLFLMSMEELFIPYEGTLLHRAVPDTLAGRAVAPATLFHGCRMTYRRSVIAQTQFDGLLRYYCPGEDLDASYRVSQVGHILTAKNAYLHHYNVSTGRIDRHKTTMLSVLNQAVLLARHSSDKTLAQKRYRGLMRRRLLAEFLKDGLSRRLDFPQLRGLWAALKSARTAFALSPEELERWYLAKQEEIIKR